MSKGELMTRRGPKVQPVTGPADPRLAAPRVPFYVLDYIRDLEAALAAERRPTPKPEAVRREFVNRLTLNGAKDMRRWNYNQAIFAPDEEGGWAVWDKTDLRVVLAAFDAALLDVQRGRTISKEA